MIRSSRFTGPVYELPVQMTRKSYGTATPEDVNTSVSDASVASLTSIRAFVKYALWFTTERSAILGSTKHRNAA